MSKREPLLILMDILDEINNIELFVKDISSFDEFQNNTLVFYATIKALENIGEAVKNLPKSVKQKYDYSWKEIAGFRDIIAHEYFGVDKEIVWDVIQTELLELRKAVYILIEQINKSQK
ncbi:MAG: DUF86 domain-containing protein [Desulfurella sp.]|jgi:uncharacterized protein with HEPN domain|uniref:HepT-like ribonuclease domain-containing protein n=1 Tax=Desulfurella sp. TaxID=1962857 RepID=UPI00177854A7|nr:DUF86 domain-containing protein [Hydrogenobaculum sp.]